MNRRGCEEDRHEQEGGSGETQVLKKFQNFQAISKFSKNFKGGSGETQLLKKLQNFQKISKFSKKFEGGSGETQLLNPSHLQVYISPPFEFTCSTSFFQPFFPPCDLVWAPYLLPQPMQPSSRQRLKLKPSEISLRTGSSRSMSSTQRTVHVAGVTAGTIAPKI